MSTCTGLSVIPCAVQPNLRAICLLLPPMPHPTSTICMHPRPLSAAQSVHADVCCEHVRHSCSGADASSQEALHATCTALKDEAGAAGTSAHTFVAEVAPAHESTSSIMSICASWLLLGAAPLG